MIRVNALLHRLQCAIGSSHGPAPHTRAPDLQLAFAVTQLLIDSGCMDAAGAIVVATWQTDSHVVFEIICAERMRTPLCGLLARALSRPFNGSPGGWLLSQHEAAALIDLNAHAGT